MSLAKNMKIFFAVLLLSVLFYSINPAYAYNSQAVQVYNEAVDFSKRGNFQEAINLFKKAVIIDPTFIDAYYNLASLYEYLGNDSQALTYFEIVLSKNPVDTEIIYKVGSLYYKKKEYDRAIDQLKKISPTDSLYPEAQELYKKAFSEISKRTPVVVQPVKPVVSSNQENLDERVVLKGLQGPTGIAKDNLGNLYIANYTANNVLKITPDGKRTVVADKTMLKGPIGLAVDSGNNVYVANYVSNQIVKITPDGNAKVILKGVNKPYYLYLDKNGMLYISEQGTNTVIKIKVIPLPN